MCCQITTLNPITEITNPARPVQSPTFIFTGSSAVILPKGRATLTLFLGATTLGAERDLDARAARLPLAISQPPISQTDGAATWIYMPSGYHLPAGAGVDTPRGQNRPSPASRRPPGLRRPRPPRGPCTRRTPQPANASRRRGRTIGPGRTGRTPLRRAAESRADLVAPRLPGPGADAGPPTCGLPDHSELGRG
jgi:hypothetical protein